MLLSLLILLMSGCGASKPLPEPPKAEPPAPVQPVPSKPSPAPQVTPERGPNALEYPVCFVLDGSQLDQVKGLDKADVVYEWFERTGQLRFAAIYTKHGTFPIGPVAPLNIGAAHIALQCGRVVCSSVSDARIGTLYFTTPALMVHSTSKILSVDDAAAEFAKAPKQTRPIEGYIPFRGETKDPRRTAAEVVFESETGQALLTWSWNGSQYERAVGQQKIAVSSLVILQTYDNGPFDSGTFPEGALSGEYGYAAVYAHGMQYDARWHQRPMPSQPRWLSDDDEKSFPLPEGPVWFHVKRHDGNYEVIIKDAK